MQMREMADQHFDGRLSAASLDQFEGRSLLSSEAREVLDRMFRLMKLSKFPPEDFSEHLAWTIAFAVARIVPSAWGGLIPPITGAGRHTQIDEYIASNPWYDAPPNATLLDLGCGFPPQTTVDAAVRFPSWQIVGADPSLAAYLVYDERGDYASFNEDGELFYFQPGAAADYDRWDEMLSDPASTRSRFDTLFQKLLPKMSKCDNGDEGEAEFAGARIVANPLRKFVRSNLTFVRGGIGDTLGLEAVNFARSLNVFIYYDGVFREQALRWLPSVIRQDGLFVVGSDWVRTTEARYTVYQRVRDRMVAREFAFSIDNLRPLTFVQWYALYDDEYDIRLIARLIATLRSDSDFIGDINVRLDNLAKQKGLCPRQSNGFLGGVDEQLSAKEAEEGQVDIAKTLAAEGYVDKAVEVLQRAGWKAWRNCVDHVAIDPSRIPRA